MRHLARAALAAAAIVGGYYGILYLWPPPGPVPQDPDAQEQRLLRTLQWNERTLAGAYQAVGKKDPRWDGHAGKALAAAARFFSKIGDRWGVLREVQSGTREAVGRGCDDPLILYLHVRSADHRLVPHAKRERQAVAAAAALARSAYPAFRRSTALLQAARLTLENPAATAARRSATVPLLDDALRLLVRSAAEDERSPKLEDIWVDHSLAILRHYREAGIAAEAALARVEAALAQAPALAATRLVVRGRFFIGYAWEARGNGFASTITSEGWAHFRRRLPQARAALEAAWKLAPGNWRAATAMLSVELGDSRGRAAMERWFERALAGNSDNLDACWVKLDWLHPKWYGSLKEHVAFGRACRDTHNWRSGIPLLVAEAHFGVCDRLPDEAARRKYLSQDDVWGDIQFVYTEHLKYHAHDYLARSEFAYYSCLCGRPAESREQFKLLGNHFAWGGRRLTRALLMHAHAEVTQAAPARPD